MRKVVLILGIVLIISGLISIFAQFIMVPFSNGGYSTGVPFVLGTLVLMPIGIIILLIEVMSGGFESKPRLYDEIEKDILDQICHPLGVVGVELDRMLYQNYQSILDMHDSDP